MSSRSVQLDGSVLISNLVSGVLWLLLLVAMGMWPLALIGAVYVGVVSLGLAAVYGAPVLTRRREVLGWLGAWFGAVSLWTLLLGSTDADGTASQYLLVLTFGVVIGTLCLLGWQIGALAVRQALRWRQPSTPVLHAQASAAGGQAHPL